MLDIKQDEKLALEQFLLNATPPILYDHGEKGIDQIGTGTLFRICGRHFLVTARHLFYDNAITYDPARIAFPETPRGITPYTFGRSNVYYPDNESIDVVVLELLQQEAVERLSSGWQFLCEGNIGVASSCGTFVLAGYPSSQLVKRGDKLGGTLLSLYTERMADLPAEAKPDPDPRIDMFFHLDEEATKLDGSMAKVPKLPGVSGASIWEASPISSAIWTPQGFLKIVGVQSAYRPGKYIRAINWLGVAEIFRKIDPDLGSAIQSAMTG
jgi:hypothetical protein